MSSLANNEWRMPDGEGYYVYEWLNRTERNEYEDDETTEDRREALRAIANDRRDFNRIRMCKLGDGQDC